MKIDFTAKVLILILALLVLLLISTIFANRPIQISKYQLEKMQVAKHNCEFENPGKQCVLIWDYAPVSKE